MILSINKNQIEFEFKHNSKNISTYSYYKYLGEHIETINRFHKVYDRHYYGWCSIEKNRGIQFEKCKYLYFERFRTCYLHKLIFKHENYETALLVIEEIIKTITKANNNLGFYFYDKDFFINSNNYFALKFIEGIGNIQLKYNYYLNFAYVRYK